MAQAKNSVAMEPLGLKKGLDRLLDEGIDEKVVTTDRHPSIRKIMRESYPDKKKNTSLIHGIHQKVSLILRYHIRV